MGGHATPRRADCTYDVLLRGSKLPESQLSCFRNVRAAAALRL